MVDTKMQHSCIFYILALAYSTAYINRGRDFDVQLERLVLQKIEEALKTLRGKAACSDGDLPLWINVPFEDICSQKYEIWITFPEKYKTMTICFHFKKHAWPSNVLAV